MHDVAGGLFVFFLSIFCFIAGYIVGKDTNNKK